MFQRYAVYFTPQASLAETGAAWLGWDIAQGCAVAQPDIDGLDVPHLTQAPRKYGLHGTIKPPFSLAAGTTPDIVQDALGRVCARSAPVRLDALEVHALAGFVALIPAGDQTALGALAARAVKDLDRFRAPAQPAELARRRQAKLTPAQEQYLIDWGYPYVMDSFRFHVTLTGRIRGNMAPVVTALRAHFGPHLPSPYNIDSLTLVGEDGDGMFHEIKRFSLDG